MKTILLPLLLLVVFTSYAPAPVSNAENANRFSFSMMNVLAEEDKNRNFVFSPYGLRNCFVYAYAGAGGNTKLQIQNGLKFQESAEEELKNYQESNALFRGCTDSKVKIANSMWISEAAAAINPKYLSLTKKYTGSVDVLRNAKQVNQWVSDNTGGEIKELVNDKELELVRVLLLNGLTLDAKWKFPFEVKNTYQGDFLTGKEKIKVPTMTAEVQGRYLESETMKIIQLAYTDALHMTIVMPLQDNVSVDWNAAMQKRLTGVRDLTGEGLWTNENNFILHLPKFQLATTINMIKPLMKLGVVDAFSSGQGDFSKMNHKLYLGLVKQKAVIETTEYGTKASAATAIGFYERGMTETIKIDRSFYFIIHHNKTGEILFMGRIVNPIALKQKSNEVFLE